MCICGDSECPSCGVAQGTKTKGAGLRVPEVGQEYRCNGRTRRVVAVTGSHVEYCPCGRWIVKRCSLAAWSQWVRIAVRVS